MRRRREPRAAVRVHNTKTADIVAGSQLCPEVLTKSTRGLLEKQGHSVTKRDRGRRPHEWNHRSAAACGSRLSRTGT